MANKHEADDIDDKYKDEEDIRHLKKMKKFDKDLKFFHLMEEQSRGHRYLKQIKSIEEEKIKSVKANIEKKKKENEYMERAVQALIRMGKTPK